MIPNREQHHDPTVQHMRALKARINMPIEWIADRTGISRRRIQYLLAGQRTQDGVLQEMKMTYPEQFVLESLAEVSDVFNHRESGS